MIAASKNNYQHLYYHYKVIILKVINLNYVKDIKAHGKWMTPELSLVTKNDLHFLHRHSNFLNMLFLKIYWFNLRRC